MKRPARARAPEGWEASWETLRGTYPLRDGDREVAKGRELFRALLAQGVEAAVVLEGVRRYRAWADATGHSGSRFVKQIPTFLRSRSWEEPWEVGTGTGPPHGASASLSLDDKLARLKAQMEERR